jgi:hypothetical protein
MAECGIGYEIATFRYGISNMSTFLMIAALFINVTILVLGVISVGVEMYVSYFRNSRSNHITQGVGAGTVSNAGPVHGLTRGVM